VLSSIVELRLKNERNASVHKASVDSDATNAPSGQQPARRQNRTSHCQPPCYPIQQLSDSFSGRGHAPRPRSTPNSGVFSVDILGQCSKTQRRHCDALYVTSCALKSSFPKLRASLSCTGSFTVCSTDTCLKSPNRVANHVVPQLVCMSKHNTCIACLCIHKTGSILQEGLESRHGRLHQPDKSII